ncbi:MAG TPA: hypothetical protein VFI46_12990 [Jiangellaceae bacterium]|nr:hypothetical protein [Jiangellaceae bacterium]
MAAQRASTKAAGPFADREVAAVLDRVERPAKPSAGPFCDPETGDPIVPDGELPRHVLGGALAARFAVEHGDRATPDCAG